ncbi:hydroxyethylthiazole kinase [Desertibacillus haloalkaliphilus]|nr:hydroxyethylthiazole kinase [Desertibacillus haloalkaliphilus]
MTTLIDQVREKQPLIHNITNQVVINFTANGLYAVGAAPVMANAVEEAADMARNADALLLNIGTLTTPQVHAMIQAGKAANQKGIPVVFDPVGVGATPFRTETAQRILQDVQVSFVRGNAGEIAMLAGLDAEIRGVDSTVQANQKQITTEAVNRIGVPVIVTGVEDIISDGKDFYYINNGHPLLTKVTGTGCLLSAVVAAFLASNDHGLEAAAGAVSFYGIAAEIAAQQTSGPGSFQTAFLDALYNVDSEQIKDLIKVKYDHSNH